MHKRKAVIEDIPYKVYGGRTELVKRLLAEKCELCRGTSYKKTCRFKEERTGRST